MGDAQSDGQPRAVQPKREGCNISCPICSSPRLTAIGSFTAISPRKPATPAPPPCPTLSPDPTDSGAALRALEIGADALLKGTRVDGVYTAGDIFRLPTVRVDEFSASGAGALAAGALKAMGLMG